MATNRMFVPDVPAGGVSSSVPAAFQNLAGLLTFRQAQADQLRAEGNARAAEILQGPLISSGAAARTEQLRQEMTQRALESEGLRISMLNERATDEARARTALRPVEVDAAQKRADLEIFETDLRRRQLELQERNGKFEADRLLRQAERSQLQQEADFSLADEIAKFRGLIGMQNWGGAFALRKSIQQDPQFQYALDTQKVMSELDQQLSQWGSSYDSEGNAVSFMDVVRMAASPDSARRKEAYRILALRSENADAFLDSVPDMSYMDRAEIRRFVRDNPLPTDELKLTQYRQAIAQQDQVLMDQVQHDPMRYAQIKSSKEYVDAQKQLYRSIVLGEHSDAGMYSAQQGDRLIDFKSVKKDIEEAFNDQLRKQLPALNLGRLAAGAVDLFGGSDRDVAKRLAAAGVKQGTRALPDGGIGAGNLARDAALLAGRKWADAVSARSARKWPGGTLRNVAGSVLPAISRQGLMGAAGRGLAGAGRALAASNPFSLVAAGVVIGAFDAYDYNKRVAKPTELLNDTLDEIGALSSSLNSDAMNPQTDSRVLMQKFERLNQMLNTLYDITNGAGIPMQIGMDQLFSRRVMDKLSQRIALTAGAAFNPPTISGLTARPGTSMVPNVSTGQPADSIATRYRAVQPQQG